MSFLAPDKEIPRVYDWVPPDSPTNAEFRKWYQLASSDIHYFARSINFHPTWQQSQLLDAVQAAEDGTGPRRIACRSGQGPGKTTATGVAVLWREVRNKYSMAIVTAPTARQCREVWITETARTIARAPKFIRDMFEVTATQILVYKKRKPFWGVKTVTASKVEAAQGFHETNMMWVGEEASGIPRDLITQIKGTLSNSNSLLILIGNPNTRDCAFFDCFYGPQSDQWVKLHWNAEDTARDYKHILDPSRNREFEEEFGRDSDAYRVRVLGEFPTTDPACVMSTEEVTLCMDPSLRLRAARFAPVKCIGIDFARFGGDESVIYRRSGNAVMDWKFITHEEPIKAVRESYQMQKDAGWSNHDCLYVVDAVGIGQGVVHALYEADKRVFEFNSHANAYRSNIYANRITEAWFDFAEKIRKEPVMLPEDSRLVHQLTSRMYTTNRKGLVELESKKDYIKRGHPSPDRADAVVMAFYDKSMYLMKTARKQSSGKIVGMKIHAL